MPPRPLPRGALPRTSHQIRNHSSNPDSPKPSLFAQLFPDLAAPKQKPHTAEPQPHPPSQNAASIPSVPPRIPRPRRRPETKSRPVPRADFSEPSMMIVTTGCTSLEPSDFNRIIPPGTLLGGQNLSIIRTIQARHPHTMAPLDKYYLFFPSRPIAEAYRAEVHRLHRLTRERFAGVPIPSDSQARAFALATPQRNTLSLPVVHGAHFVRLNFRPGFPAGDPLAPPPPGQMVCLRLVGERMSCVRLLEVIRRDGVERNLEWDFLPADWCPEGVAPHLKHSGANSKSSSLTPQAKTQAQAQHEDTSSPEGSRAEENDKDQDPMKALHSIFYLNFPSRPEARRFLRSWHQRVIRGTSRDRSSVVDVSLIW